MWIINHVQSSFECESKQINAAGGVLLGHECETPDERRQDKDKTSFEVSIHM